MRSRSPAGGQDGFTLIELMVVVLIIAILIAIAIPSYLGARQRAADRAAQANLRNALTAAKVLYTDNATYLDATPVNLTGAGSDLVYVDSTTLSDGPSKISVLPVTDQLWYGAVHSTSGKCFYVKETGATAYGTDSTVASCKGDTAPTLVYTTIW